ncbi:MAG: ATP-binding protein [Candidatus Ancillula trichonymphae]|jgi:Cdc6-like AAA superfamily ATPase|nr:ATP-binding protein [Candidatus Ancillula trichonymphae]
MNPFNPTFNDPPEILYGREEDVEKVKTSLLSSNANPHRGVIIQGKRGTGKTSMLTTISRWARQGTTG